MVALGGSVGAVARYAIGVAVVRLLGSGFPYGTMFVNIVGSFIMGLVAAWLVARGVGSEKLQALIAVGFLGSFTTFSTFSLDMVRLIEVGRYGDAALYMLVSVLVGVTALVAGLAAGRLIVGS